MRRRLGRAALVLDEGEAKELVRQGAPFVPAGWGADEAGRALLLLAPAAGPQAEAVVDLFAKGEMREQQAVLRVLAHLPDPGKYVALAAEAVRTNVLSVLEALACDNPFLHGTCRISLSTS